LDIFRHLSQKSLDIRQYACGISIQSDEKSHGASSAQSLCGIALMDIIDVYKISYFRQHTTISDIFRQILLLHDTEKNVIICRLNKKKGGK